MSNFWRNKKVLVTGGAGFIGSHVVEKLVQKEARVTVLDNLQNATLQNLAQVRHKIKLINGDCSDQHDADRACKQQEIIMNLVARVGGIEYNRTHQATMLKDNLLTSLVILEAGRRAEVDRFLVVSSACVYPNNCSIPTKEGEGFLGEPETTNEGYGWAKRMSEKLGMYYHTEFGMNIGIVRPYNCYGPRDHFNPQTSHVIPSLIRRVLSGENPVLVWGTGKQTRAFLYVEDLAQGMIAAIEKYPVPDPINLGTDYEVSIKKLIEMVMLVSGLSYKIQFDTSKPDGSPRRASDNTKARKIIGFKATTGLKEGLTKTIKWYQRNLRKT